MSDGINKLINPYPTVIVFRLSSLCSAVSSSPRFQLKIFEIASLFPYKSSQTSAIFFPSRLCINIFKFGFLLPFQSFILSIFLIYYLQFSFISTLYIFVCVCFYPFFGRGRESLYLTCAIFMLWISLLCLLSIT